MVKTPTTRHSRVSRDPVTIDLEAEEVAASAQSAMADSASSEEAPAVPSGSASPVADYEFAPSGKVEGAHASVEEPLAASVGKAAEPAPAPAAEAQTPRRGSSALLAGALGGLIGAVLAGGGLYLARPAPENPSAALATELSALRDEVAALKSADNAAGALSQQVDGLRAELDALRQAGAGAPAPDLAPLEARVGKLESTVANLPRGAAATDLSAVNERIAAVEAGTKSATDAATALQDRVAAAEQSLSGLSARLDAQAAQPKVALAIAAAALKSAVDRGGSFTTELDTFAALAPDSPELAALRPHAEAGVPARAEILATVDEAASAMVAAARPADPNAGFLDRLLDSARSLVAVRPVGEVAGTGAPQTVARIEVAVKAGDFRKALTEYETLPDAAKAAGAEFAARLKARLEVETAVGQAIAGAMKA